MFQSVIIEFSSMFIVDRLKICCSAIGYSPRNSVVSQQTKYSTYFEGTWHFFMMTNVTCCTNHVPVNHFMIYSNWKKEILKWMWKDAWCLNDGTNSIFTSISASFYGFKCRSLITYIWYLPFCGHKCHILFSFNR